MINVGDVVNLKSGGPDMTVIEIKDNIGGRYAECVYFSESNNLEGPFSFHVLCLEQKSVCNRLKVNLSIMDSEVFIEALNKAIEVDRWKS